MAGKYIKVNEFKPNTRKIRLVRFVDNEGNYDGPSLVITSEDGRIGVVTYYDDTFRAMFSRFVVAQTPFGKEVACSDYLSNEFSVLQKSGLDHTAYFQVYNKHLKNMLIKVGISPKVISAYEKEINKFIDELMEYLV